MDKRGRNNERAREKHSVGVNMNVCTCTTTTRLVDAERGREALDVVEQAEAARERRVDAAPLGEVRAAAVDLEVALARAEAKQVARLDVARRDLLEEVVECRVRVRDEQDALRRLRAVEVRDDLHGDIRLARARRSDDHREARLRSEGKRRARSEQHKSLAHAGGPLWIGRGRGAQAHSFI